MTAEEFIADARKKGLVVAEGPRPKLPASIGRPGPGESEAVFTTRVIDLATANGWLAMHPLPGRYADGYRTGTQGHTGYPDITATKGGRLVLAELKVKGRKPSPEQRRWLDELATVPGVVVRLWTPADWPEIEATFTGG